MTAESPALRTAPLPTLGDLDGPTLEIARERIAAISDKLVTMITESTRLTIKVRYPKHMPICRGLRWQDGSFTTTPHVPSSPMEALLQTIALSANTPKLRSQALDNLRRIEQWLDQRIDGVRRHGEHVRELQGIYVGKLKAEIAMVSLKNQRDRTDEFDLPF